MDGRFSGGDFGEQAATGLGGKTPGGKMVPGGQTASAGHTEPPGQAIPRQLDFHEILRLTQSHIRAYIAGLGVPRHDVDDIAQDVYVEFYRAIDRVPADASPTQWLKGIARNLSMNYFRRSTRRGRLHREALAELLWHAESDLNGQQRDSASDARERLGACFEKLPSASRKMLKMRYEQEMPSQTIAAKMNSTAEAVRVALFRIRAVLKECIGKPLVE